MRIISLAIAAVLATAAFMAVAAVCILALTGLYSVGIDLGKVGIWMTIGGGLGAATATWRACKRWTPHLAQVPAQEPFAKPSLPDFKALQASIGLRDDN